MSDDHDPILDACLDEVLTGRRPPDLTARIMQALAMRGHAGPALPGVAPPGVALPGTPVNGAPPRTVAASVGGSASVAAAARNSVPLPPPVFPPLDTHSLGAQVDAVQRDSVGRGVSVTSRPRRSAWSSAARPAMAIAASLLVVAGVGIVLLNSSRPEVVSRPSGEHRSPSKSPQTAIAKTQSPSATASPDSVAAASPSTGDPASAASDLPRVGEAGPVTPGVNPPREPLATVEPAPRPNDTAPAPKYVEPSPTPEIISFVNAELGRSWTENGVEPASPATEAEWCRRLFVRFLGRIPTVGELQTFLADKSPGKREALVDRLLTDEDYVVEYASHWATAWTNVLIGRTGGSGDSLASREGLEQFLRTSLAQNKPYDKLVYELLTAVGSSEPGSEGYNGAVNFLLDGMNEENTLASARVSRVFLGQQLQCAQCHTHPSQDWSQEDFWSFNAFFRQLHAEKLGTGERSSVRLTSVDFPGEGAGSMEGEVFYETPQGLLKSAFPRFIDGTTIPTSGELAVVDRRAELARLVVNSPEFPQALVNRLWSHFFGYGFTQPVDDMGPNSTPSHPELLARLSEEFVAHRFDLKAAIRWLALSDPFSRSSKLADLASKDMPEAGSVALFSRYYSRQMQAEEVYNSLVQAAQIRKTGGTAADIEKARVDWLAQFSRNMDTDDAMEEQHFNGSMRQSLIMMNGDLMNRAVSSQHEGLLKTVAASPMKFEKKVEHLFLSALSREPTRREQQAAATILQSGGGNESAALEDIWWALLNSNEFILDH